MAGRQRSHDEQGTLYLVDPHVDLAADAERRARERGCTCRATYLHRVERGTARVTVIHRRGCALTRAAR